MNEPLDPDGPPARPPVLTVDATEFLRRLAVATLGLFLFLMAVYLLRQFQVILQPLFVAVFLGYLILPAHDWLARQGVPSLLAYVLILLLALGVLFGVGALAYQSFQQVAARLPGYELRLENLIRRLAAQLPFETPALHGGFLREWGPGAGSAEDFAATLRAAAGTFVDFFTGLAVTFVYLIFLSAEKFSFPRRITLAFGDARGRQVLEVVGSINQAIAQYLAVKFFVSFVAGLLSLAVLGLFGVDFFVLWGILIFLLNFIPYLGSLVAVTLPILLSFVQLDELWKGLVIAGLLVAIQQVIGTWVEPRMAGQRLGVSPLLILLSLSFWGLLWGVVGMILAVPLLMVVKIILANIRETRPLATLMSNL